MRLLLPIDTPIESRTNKPYAIYNKEIVNEIVKQNLTNKNKKNLDPRKIKIDWSDIIGYENIKYIIDKILINKNDKKTHCLIVGEAGTSKTVFLKTIEKSLLEQNYNVHYLDSTTLSSSGVIEYMFSNEIEYMLLDELDKLEKEHQSCFLNLLESGLLQETKHKKIRKKDMQNTIIVATGNYIEKILNPLKTRFLVLNIPKYTKEQFYDIGIKLLCKKYGKTKDIAFYIVNEIWKIYHDKRQESPNLRQCVQVATLSDNTKESINPILQGLEQYSLKIDVE